MKHTVDNKAVTVMRDVVPGDVGFEKDHPKKVVKSADGVERVVSADLIEEVDTIAKVE